MGLKHKLLLYDRQFGFKNIGTKNHGYFCWSNDEFCLAFVVFIIIAFLQGVPTNEPKLGEITPDGAANACWS